MTVIRKPTVTSKHDWEIAAFPIHIQWPPLWSSCDSCRPSWRRQSFQTYSAAEIETRSNFWSAQSVWRCGCQTVIGRQHIHGELRPAVVPFMLITRDPAAPHPRRVSKQHHIRWDKWLELLQGRVTRTVKSPGALASGECLLSNQNACFQVTYITDTNPQTTTNLSILLIVCVTCSR